MMSQLERWFFYGCGAIIVLLFAMLVIIRGDRSQCVTEAMKQNRTAEEIVKICR